MSIYWNDDGKAKYQITAQNYGAYSVEGYTRTYEEARKIRRAAYAKWGNAQIRERKDWIIER